MEIPTHALMRLNQWEGVGATRVIDVNRLAVACRPQEGGPDQSVRATKSHLYTAKTQLFPNFHFIKCPCLAKCQMPNANILLHPYPLALGKKLKLHK